MPFTAPGPGDVHVNRPLTNIAIAYMQSAMNFVADRAFPMVDVDKQTDNYFTIPRGEFWRDEFRVRRPGTESAAATYKVGTETYSCEVRALHHDVSDQTRANTDDPLDADRQAVDLVTQKGLIRKERNWATEYFVTNVWDFEGAGAATRHASLDFSHATNNTVIYWDSMNSTPVVDVRLMKQYVQEATGFEPNVAVISKQVYNVLIDHDDIIGRLDRGQTTGPAMANRDSLAAIFEVDEVLVMNGVFNNADEGATDNFDFIGGKHMLLLYRPPTPGIYIPSAGYTFNWTGYAASVMGGVEISRFRMEHLKSDRVEGEMAWDQKVVSDALGGFFKDIIQ